MLNQLGWFHIRGKGTYYYRSKDEDEKEAWPPKYSKFSLQTSGEQIVEAAFTDSRRFSRIRLVDCVAEAIRKMTPLKENGPDPVIDKDILTVEWLEQKLNKKQVPIKAFLLNQANISGIGNWVGSVVLLYTVLTYADTTNSDEILYNARLHPEQYSNTFSTDEINRLHASMMYICKTAVDLLADSSKFPDDWMFKHRWGKGKKDGPTALPNGEIITFLTVGGRTSCVVPNVQKKTGAVAGDLKKGLSSDSEAAEDAPAKTQTSRKRKVAVASMKSEEADENGMERNKSKATSGKFTRVKRDISDDDSSENVPTKIEKLTKEKKSKSTELKVTKDIASTRPRRRSGRHAKAGSVWD